MKLKKIIINLSIFLFVIALLGSAAIIYLNVTSKKANAPQENASISAAHNYQIVTRSSLKVWPAGTIFAQGLPAYFYASMPYVGIIGQVNANGKGDIKLDGTIRTQVTLRAINDKSEAYWSYPIFHSSEEAFQLTNDKPIYQAKQIDVDPSASYDLANQIAEEILFQSSQFQLVVSSHINVSGSIGNISVDKSFDQELPISLLASSFTLPRTEDSSSNILVRSNITAPSLEESYIGIINENRIPIAIIGVSVIFILLLLWMKSKTGTKLMADHRKYKDWITEGTVEISNQYFIQINSLQGLVDLAIDLDKRVIYDSGVMKYYVVDEDMIYVFDAKRKYTLNDNKQQLGKLLLNQGLIQPEQLEMALYYQNKIGYRLGESLIALGFIDETTLFSTLAAQSKLDYYEAGEEVVVGKPELLEKKNVNKAKALMAFPLGVRADQTLVVACSEFSREGITQELKKVFERELHMAAVSPSFINRCFQQLDTKEELPKSVATTQDTPLPKELSEKEQKEFITAYYHGTVDISLILQYMGFLDQELLIQKPKKEGILPWLVGKQIISGEISNMMKGLDKAVKNLELKERQSKQCPTLTKLLIHSNYITPESEDWIRSELEVQKLPLNQLLVDNYLASPKTVEQAEFLIDALKRLVG